MWDLFWSICTAAKVKLRMWKQVTAPGLLTEETTGKVGYNLKDSGSTATDFWTSINYFYVAPLQHDVDRHLGHVRHLAGVNVEQAGAKKA